MDKKLLDILACPICKQPVIYKKESMELICKLDKLAFPIEEDIPVMLEEKARRMSSEEVDTHSF